jgi:fused signal recognition particle receptor
VVDSSLLLIALAVLVIVIAIGAFVYVRRRSAVPTEARPSPKVRKPKERGLRSKLSRTRSVLGDRLGAIFGRDRLDAQFWDDLEETLVAADVGAATSAQVVDEVRRRAPEDGDVARRELEDVLIGKLEGRERDLRLSGDPAAMLVVGVNGTGKTTSIAKLAARLNDDGHHVILAAADTYRAAADEQLKTWAARVGVPVVSGVPGADPASVAHDGLTRARRDDFDVVIVDTAGRLHSKTNLMNELSKVARILRREAGTLDEVLLVLDGTTGQNGIQQARSFTEAVAVTGVVLTKLDGTSRGGVAIAVEEELDIPVKFIGVGEGVEDLVPFEPREFVEALLEP